MAGEKGKKQSGFVTRLISGIVLVLIAVITVRAGGAVLLGTLGILAVIGVFELYRAMNVLRQMPLFGPLAAAGLIGTGIFYVLLYFGLVQYYLIFFILLLIAMMTVYVLTYPGYAAEEVMAALFSVLYAGGGLACMYVTRENEAGILGVVLIFLSAWGADTCAYCVGMLIGKHKMTPVLSPKKSVEGAVGGVAGAVLLGIIAALIAHRQVFVCGLICFFGAILSEIGDLAASAIKRNRGIKDFGTLIPGHGGVMDRFDSILFTAPVICFLSMLLMH